jgi:hypothetical protein
MITRAATRLPVEHYIGSPDPNFILQMDEFLEKPIHPWVSFSCFEPFALRRQEYAFQGLFRRLPVSKPHSPGRRRFTASGLERR